MFIPIVLTLFSCVLAAPNPNSTNEEPNTRATWKDCASGIFNPACVKISAISLLEKLNSKQELKLLPGIALVKEGNEKENTEEVIAFAKSLPAEEKLDKFFLYRLGNYLDSHSLKLKLMDTEVVREARSLMVEARGKDPLGMGGKKGGLGVLVAMAMMMKEKVISWLESLEKLYDKLHLDRLFTTKY